MFVMHSQKASICLWCTHLVPKSRKTKLVYVCDTHLVPKSIITKLVYVCDALTWSLKVEKQS